MHMLHTPDRSTHSLGLREGAHPGGGAELPQHCWTFAETQLLQQLPLSTHQSCGPRQLRPPALHGHNQLPGEFRTACAEDNSKEAEHKAALARCRVSCHKTHRFITCCSTVYIVLVLVHVTMQVAGRHALRHCARLQGRRTWGLNHTHI